MARVGIIGDTHFPAVHPGYLSFCRDTFEAWDVNQYVHIGDVNDLHNPSFHDLHPGMPGAKDECKQSLECIRQWQRVFPVLKVCLGNHDERSVRVNSKYGVDPDTFLKPYAEAWKTPEWTWMDQHVIDSVLYVHGHGKSSGAEYPAFNYLKKGIGMSVVLGHFHTKASVKWLAGPKTRWFAMDVGCGIDRDHPAMHYDRLNPMKQILSCAVVLDGKPYHEIMECGPGEKYHRARFAKKRFIRGIRK